MSRESESHSALLLCACVPYTEAVYTKRMLKHMQLHAARRSDSGCLYNRFLGRAPRRRRGRCESHPYSGYQFTMNTSNRLPPFLHCRRFETLDRDARSELDSPIQQNRVHYGRHGEYEERQNLTHSSCHEFFPTENKTPHVEVPSPSVTRVVRPPRGQIGLSHILPVVRRTSLPCIGFWHFPQLTIIGVCLRTHVLTPSAAKDTPGII